MRFKTIALAGIIAGGGMVGSVLAPPVALAQTSSADSAVIRSFRSVLRRDPTNRELTRYRTLMVRNGWTAADVRRDLAARTDYRYYRNDTTSTRPTAAVRSAYRDVLGREPDDAGLRNYRDKIVRQGWTEQDVREALRNSPEYASSDSRIAAADAIIRRAYQDVLHREPDASGLETYRREILENGWEYHDLRQVLMRSDERRLARSLNPNDPNRDANATQMVRRAYLSVLGREPDAAGLQNYRERILRDGWSEDQVVRALRQSPEGRDARGVNRDANATQMVRRAYLSVLEREPDASGLQTYRDKILREGWTEARVAQTLRDSEEYRLKHPR
jgi:TorA maturation chaperone TorD